MNTPIDSNSITSKIIRFSAHNPLLILVITGIMLIISYYSIKNIPLDAIPDLSDTQVIVYSRWDRSPDIIEDQVTYPIITGLLGAPKVKVIRGFSDFGYSFVYVIFQDGTDIYWARSRVLEYLSRIQSRLPEGVQTELGPDATGVGWVFQYALVDKSGKNSLTDIRSFQDFKLRYLLNAIPGVAEVAGIGGFKKQYQVTVNPIALQAYGISMESVVQKIRESNQETGARLMELSGAEYMIRGKGYIRSLSDIETISLGTDTTGTPVLIKNVAKVDLGPDLRRGISDLDGNGDTVGGIIVMRHGENALSVIEEIKKKITDITPSLPKGLEIITTYDRSELILNAIHNLKEKLLEEMIIVSLVILVFLWHFPSAIVPILTIPISVIISFIPMYAFGIHSNIMSLSGIAISIGVLVDGAIVEVENAYKNWKNGTLTVESVTITLLGSSTFRSCFLPVFTLVDQEGRLFRPLAYSKNLAMAIAAILALTLDPAFRMLFTRMDPFTFKNKFLSQVATTLLVGKYHKEENHPISKFLFKYYEPACSWVLLHPKKIILASFFAVLLTIPVYLHLGSEFMPPLYEESLLYMPTTLPGISVAEAERLMVNMDRKLKSIPEVVRVFGKAGRADTATDNAPFSMMETVVLVKPQNEWRKKERFYSKLPDFTHFLFRSFATDRISKEELIEIMDKELSFPGVSNAWTMPIKTRIDMLSTGLRTPIGIKIQGESLDEIERLGIEIERVLKNLTGVRSVFAERVTGGYFLDINLKREKLARYGITIASAQNIILTAIGGEPITQTIEGRERYTVNIRYPRALRENIDQLKRILIPTLTDSHIPIGEIADLEYKTGPAMIRDENGFLTGYVYLDTGESDIGGFVESAKSKVSESVKLTQGYTLIWTGQYENIIRVRERMKFVIPITLFIIFFLIYMNTKSYTKTFIVMCAVPFSLIGAFAILFLLDYQMSIAVWVGMIALMGLDAETGVFMLLYLDLSYEDAKKKGLLKNDLELREAILHGAVKRVRPKIMTVLCAMMGLLPIMWSTATGSDVMKRIAAPMVGGLVSSFALELLVYPAIYYLWKRKEIKNVKDAPAKDAPIKK
ncbi:MAG: efflux RND transporter permease subunit [Leptospiraceae bacterium]|nr:efflux RND transporter permease subunit [Leptospiraceae bacterium]